VSRYLVLDELGSGGMGRVFSAHDPELDRRVAIKVLFDGSNVPSSSGANELLREGRALASLRHPNIVSVYDVGWYEGELFIAMEYVEGQTLDTWQREHSKDHSALLRHYLEAGAGLAAAHDASVIHGDFKPANVMVEDSGRTVVLDFGLARSMTDPEKLRDSDRDGTTRGVGTPAYMAPEQHNFERPTQWSDQFSFCVAVYEAFVGRRPFPHKSVLQLTHSVLSGKWEEPGDAMPAWVWHVVRRGLQVDPRDRFVDMHALLRALDPVRRRRRIFGIAGGTLALAGLAGLGTLAAERPGPCSQSEVQLAGIWDADVRAELDARHEDTAAWPSVRTQLDGFASAWTAAWQETCEATHVHETQSEALLDHRMACLQSDRVAVEAAIHQLAEGDRSVVQRAARLRVFDRDGNRCRTRSLGNRVPPPPPGPERDEYELLLRVAAEQYALAAMANDPSTALRRLDGIETDETTHPDVVRALEFSRAEAYLQLDQPKEAHAAWSRAAEAADAAGDDAAFVKIASVLAYLEVRELDRQDAADVWLDRARSRSKKVDLNHRERFTLELRAAVVTRAGGEPKKAAQALEDLLESEGPFATDDHLGTLHHNLGELRNQLRQRDEAVEHFRLAIEYRSAALGPDHRQVGQSRFLLSRVHIEQGALDLAEEELEQAAEIFAHVEGGAAERVMAEEARAILSAMRGDPARASEQMRSVIELAQNTLDPDDRRNATLLVNHARMLMMLGKLDEAATEVTRGIELEERVVGPKHHGLVDGLSLLAEIELGRGNADEAEALSTRAAELASSPHTALELRVSALVARAHAQCHVEAAQEAAAALLDEAPEDVSPQAVEALRAAVADLSKSVGAYPSCTDEPNG
jgi:tetratricopeptide (TPR) repeat protein/predicted Ser/Thr protein kinase